VRIPSGVIDQVIFFVAVDSVDLKTRETGLTTFTVYRARDTGAATVMTTPTVAELSAANMPGVYSLLLDEDMTIAAGNDSEEMVFHITQAAMAPVTRSIELYRPKITAGNTLDVTATGGGGIDWANVEGQGTTVGLTATTVATVTTTTTATNVTTVNGLAANVITAASMAADAGTEIAAAVWNEDATGHQTLGTFGQAIGDPVADTNTIYKAVITDATGATVGVDVVAVKADTAAILIDTAEIGAAGAGLTAIDLPNQTMDITGNITGNLSGSVGSVTGAVGSVTAGVTVAVGGIATTSFAAGAIDAAALAADAIGASEFAQAAADKVFSTSSAALPELAQAIPSATPRPDQALMLGYMALRNASQSTATERRIKNDAGTVIAKATMSDNGTTFDQGELVAGP